MGYLFPFDRSVVRSQDFGANPGWGPNPPGGHNGDDWATPIGTPVRAAGDGVVVFAGQFDDTYADNFGWNLMYGGNMVVLNMDGETAPYFEYGHNSKLLVKAGDRVRRGQIIALTGNTDGGTNISTGPHCHVGCLPCNFNLNTNTYGRVNPRLYMTDYWEDEAAGTSLGPAGEITTQKEDELSAAEVNEIKEHINAVLIGGYTWGDEKRPGIAAVMAETQRRVDLTNEIIIPGEKGKRNAGPLFATLAAIQGENAGLLAALKATGSGQPVDLEAVKAAAKAGSEEALAELQAIATTTVTLSQEG